MDGGAAQRRGGAPASSSASPLPPVAYPRTVGLVCFERWRDSWGGWGCGLGNLMKDAHYFVRFGVDERRDRARVEFLVHRCGGFLRP
jgi:hypothetical protein